jgi:hypothetical protein
MQFLADSPVFIETTLCDRQTLCWTERALSKNFSIPLFFYNKDDGRRYLITDFNGGSPLAAESSAKSFEEALDISLYAYTDIAIDEWVQIYRISLKFKLDFKEFYQKHGGEFGDASDIARLSSKDFPKEFIQYLKEKRINRSTVSLAIKVWDMDKALILSVIQRKPTAQTFKRFVEDAIDFSGSPRQRRTPDHIALIDSLKEIASSVSPVSIQNPDNFETNSLRVNFTAENFEEFSTLLNRLSSALPLVEKFYLALKEKL